ncbi:hypothetical protein ACFE04_000250 [Oxalis oulophora]
METKCLVYPAAMEFLTTKHMPEITVDHKQVQVQTLFSLPNEETPPVTKTELYMVTDESSPKKPQPQLITIIKTPCQSSQAEDKSSSTVLCSQVSERPLIMDDPITRIKISRAALSGPCSENMVIEAINNLQSICTRTPYNKVDIQSAGLLPLLIKFLEYKSKNIRSSALELLRLLVEDDENAKEVIGRTLDLSIIIRMLSSRHKAVRYESLLFLLELSRSQPLCKKIGLIPGGILMLISIKYDHRPGNSFSSVKADEILRNLESCSENIKCMAESGLFVPLVDHLIKGSDETQIEMASYLGDIILGEYSQKYVAQRASPVLLKLIRRGNVAARKSAFRALAQISSYHPNTKILLEAGIMLIMANELFTTRNHHESKTEAAVILANVLESGVEPEKVQVNTHGHTMCSDYVVYNIFCMLRNSNPDELNVTLIRIMSCLTKSSKSTATIVSVVKETEEAIYTLIELINNPREEVRVAAMKLLIELAPFMGHTLCERLCKTRGQPENLIEYPNSDTIRITKKQAVSVNFLSKLPHDNLTLNLALLSRNVVPKILESIYLMQTNGMLTTRDTDYYLEGLVGILVRFTSTLYQPQVMLLAMDNSLTSVFTELLIKTSSNEIKRLSAMGLENLSSQTVNLSKAPQSEKPKLTKVSSLRRSLSFSSSKGKRAPVCPVHRGICSSDKTFCLIEAKAVEGLLHCLRNEKAEVVEAALSAICTLIDEKLDLEESVKMLSQWNAIDYVLKVINENKHEGSRQKLFWMIDMFFENGGVDISRNRMLRPTLMNAIDNGDVNISQIAEKILRQCCN